jgi:hypothetical protein
MDHMDLRSKKVRFKYWLTACLLAVYALVGWLRLQGALSYWYYLLELGLRPHPLYLLISGGLIGLGYSLAFLLHLLRHRGAPILVRIFGIGLIVWVWVDRIWIGIRETFFNLLPITLLITTCTISLDILLVRKLEYKQAKKEEHGADS